MNETSWGVQMRFHALGRAIAVSVAAGALVTSLPAAASAAQEGAAPKTKMFARFTVDLLDRPGGTNVIGQIYEGVEYEAPGTVEGPALPPGTCKTTNPGTSWRLVQLKEGVVGYTSVYCIF